MDRTMTSINKNLAWYNKIKWIYIILGLYVLVYITHLLIKFHFVLWDEAVYIGIDKYIYSLGSVGLWESIRPLGLPLLFGLPWKLGLNAVISARVIEMIFGAGTILLVYLIAKKMFDERIAVLSAFIYTITPLFVYNSFRIMSEIPSTFFVLLALYLFIDKKYILSGAATSLAFMFRYPQGLILVCILLALFLEFILIMPSRSGFVAFVKNSLKYAAGFVPVMIAMLIFNYFKYSSVLYPFKMASLHQGNLVHAQGSVLAGLIYYPFTLFIQNHLLIFSLVGIFVAVWIIVKGRKTGVYTSRISDVSDMTTLLIILVLYLAYYTQMTNKQDRFAISFLPFVAILAGYGFVAAFEKIKSLHSRWRFFLMTVLVLFSLYSVALSLHKDYYKFNSFPADEPQIVDEYYRFLDRKSVV